MSEEKRPKVIVGHFCKRHAAALVRRCSYGPEDAWRVLDVVARYAMFKAAVSNPTIKAKYPNAENLSGLGCLACKLPTKFEQVIQAGKKGISHIKALGESFLNDAEFGDAGPDTDATNEDGKGTTDY